MNKADLVDLLTPVVGRDKAGPVIEVLAAGIIQAVASGHSVTLTGFGTFERAERAGRTGRNPHTGEAVPVPARAAPKFRPGAAFKEAVEQPGAVVLGRRKPARKPIGVESS